MQYYIFSYVLYSLYLCNWLIITTEHSYILYCLLEALYAVLYF